MVNGGYYTTRRGLGQSVKLFQQRFICRRKPVAPEPTQRHPFERLRSKRLGPASVDTAVKNPKKSFPKALPVV